MLSVVYLSMYNMLFVEALRVRGCEWLTLRLLLVMQVLWCSLSCSLYRSRHVLLCCDGLLQLPMNKLTDLLRMDVAQAGFTEALTFTLVSHGNHLLLLFSLIVFVSCSTLIIITMVRCSASVFFFINMLAAALYYN